MREVAVRSIHPDALGRVVPHAHLAALLERVGPLTSALGDASVIHVNSTSRGGGVAEMLAVLLPYARGAGVRARWFVIEADQRFFAITKRIHNHLYGTVGDGGALGDAEHDHYQAVLAGNGIDLAAIVRDRDIVVLHDPQTAGLAPGLRSKGTTVIWRCHVGLDMPNAENRIGWGFLRRYLEPPAADAYVFSRVPFAPDWLPPAVVHEIPPSIDPFSSKNAPLEQSDVRAILAATGLLAGPEREVFFRRSDGSRGRIEHGSDLARTGPPPDPETPLVVQVSRWDRLKDMTGVLAGFAEPAVAEHGAHLVLAGPVVTAVDDDPEGAAELEACRTAWRQLSHAVRRRITLACLPMADLDENATIVNALQRHAAVVVQKSLAEGFGLTVAEAMYKARPVVASAVGGIVDQVVDGRTGILLAEPRDLAAFAGALERVLAAPRQAAAMGRRGRERVIERFLPDTHLARWADLLLGLRAAR